MKSKGLSDEQINEACAKAGVSSTPEKIPPSPHANYPLIVQNPQTTWLVRLRDAANVLVICGGLAGALWYLWKVNLHYKFCQIKKSLNFNIPKLNSANPSQFDE